MKLPSFLITVASIVLSKESRPLLNTIKTLKVILYEKAYTNTPHLDSKVRHLNRLKMSIYNVLCKKCFSSTEKFS